MESRMYSVIIDGYFSGLFHTVSEAMECVQKKAMPFKSHWKILDPFQSVYCQG
jgi:hypothetical protein